MPELTSSPLKPWKPAGIQKKREGRRGDQSKQQRNALHQLERSALPLACLGMCNYSAIKVPQLVTVCVLVCVSLAVLGDHAEPCQQCGLDRSGYLTQVSHRVKKRKA